jgi:putative ABC transport system ATP-binding protein
MSEADVPPVLSLRQVSRDFGTTPVVHALRPTDLDIMTGDYLAIVGPSGSGKSTLLNLLGLLDRPTGGEYIVGGVDTATAPERVRTVLRAQRIGFVFQSFHLMPQRSVLDNVLLATLYSGRPRAHRKKQALAALDRVGLSHRIDFLPTVLSGGERQRVAVARAVVTVPDVLLADEPTGNLDSESSASVMDLFDDLHRDGLTLVVITHDAGVAARAGRRVSITDGRLQEAS